MNGWTLALVICVCLLLSALYSGSETGMYSLSRNRLDLEAREGGRRARLLRFMLRGEAGLLITLLIGNNLVLQVATVAIESDLSERGYGEHLRELLFLLVFAPLVFLFGEVLPKDLFRRRPHKLMQLAAPVLIVTRVLFYPLAIVLRGVTALLERVFGLESERVSREASHAHLERLIEEGRRAGALNPDAERLARNAMHLRTLPIQGAMVPWSEVELLHREAPEEELRRRVEEARHTRLPVVESDGRIECYVHQLDALAAIEESPVLSHARPLASFEPGTAVDRALTRLRDAGQRQAVVGSPQAPSGLITLKDLVEEISGELASW